MCLAVRVIAALPLQALRYSGREATSMQSFVQGILASITKCRITSVRVPNWPAKRRVRLRGNMAILTRMLSGKEAIVQLVWLINYRELSS